MEDIAGFYGWVLCRVDGSLKTGSSPVCAGDYATKLDGAYRTGDGLMVHRTGVFRTKTSAARAATAWRPTADNMPIVYGNDMALALKMGLPVKPIKGVDNLAV